MKNSFSAVFYAINGTGFGHLSRLWAIAKALRQFSDALNLKSDCQILTTSDADFLVKDFPVWKLPSKTLMGNAAAYSAKAKMFTAHLLSELKPDILVLDTQPEGAFSEFFFVKDFSSLNVFIDRKKDAQFSESDLHLAHLKLYQLILVPDREENSAEYPIAEELRLRRRFTGEIHRFEPSLSLNREELRRYFDVPESKIFLYVSAGGGGDEHAEKEIEFFIRALDPEKYFLLIGYGALFKGNKIYQKNVIPLSEGDSWRYFAGIDAAISAGGYNSFHELHAACVPVLFYAQKKGMDRQDLRIAAGEKEGKNLCLSSFSENELDEKLTFLLQNREFFIQNLQKISPSNGAFNAAYEILMQFFLQNNLPQTALSTVYALQKSRYFSAEDFSLASRLFFVFIKETYNLAEREQICAEMLNNNFRAIPPDFALVVSAVSEAKKLNIAEEKEMMLFFEKIISEKKSPFSLPNKLKLFADFMTEVVVIRHKIAPEWVFSLVLLRISKNRFVENIFLLKKILSSPAFFDSNSFSGTFFASNETFDNDFLRKLCPDEQN